MTEIWTERQVNWTIKDVGAPLLDSLAGGLYSKLEVFREYVQNAVDSYVDFQSSTGLVPLNTVQVWVDSDNAALHIKDDGIGMDWDDINTAKSIAVSPKLARINEFVGFRGLGIWSGLSACEQLVLTTSKVGVPYGYKLIIDCKDIVDHLQDPIPIDELLQGRFHIQESPWSTEEHFTQVKLVNIYQDRFGALLNIKEITQYAEQYLPVQFDPEWIYTQTIVNELKNIPWTENYLLTINGEQVYRRFPPVTEIKLPEFKTIQDDNKRTVAFAWFCETNRRGQKKAIEVPPDKGWVRNFAIRIKNFTIGQRGLYKDQKVTDPVNLDWFVGEIYVTDTDIRPDTKRAYFHPSIRHDDVIDAISKFYTSVALRARGWSQQVGIEDDYAQVKYAVEAIEKILTNDNLKYKNKIDLLEKHRKKLEELWRSLVDAKTDANKADAEQEAERTLIIRSYLRKQEVKQAIDGGLGLITKVTKELEKFSTETSEQVVHIPSIVPTITTNAKSDRSKARTKRLKGKPVSTDDVFEGTLPGFEAEPEPKENKNQWEFMDLNTVIEVISTTVATVVGEGTEVYRRVMNQVYEELQRRGFHV